MFNEDSVQTHNTQEQKQDRGLMQNNNFDYPSSPKPTRILVSNNSYHVTTNTKRRTKRSSTLQSMKTNESKPPNNRLAFITAVKIAWALQMKQQQRTRKKMTTRKENMVHSDISIVKNKLDFPPITAEALSELSVSQLFKSLQIRHDLLIDPNLTFRPNLTTEKAHESHLYWTRLDHLIKFCSNTHESDDHYQLIFLVRNLLTELSLILISLISPFSNQPATSFVWNWPPQITENYILSVLDPDLVHQQLTQGCLNVDFKFSFLHSILQPLCPEQAVKIQKLVHDNQYARALELCFLTLETIKLDCVNKALHYYRPYLIETGSSLEWKIFLNQLDNGEVDTSSVSQWLKGTYDRLGSDAKFITVFRTGIISLVTDDHDTINALRLPELTFPVTFCYDEKRLKHQMRHEFQNIIVIGLLLLPYRLMAGKKAKESDLVQLKTTYSTLLKDASITSGRVSCFHLAIHACNMAKDVVLSKQDMIEQAKYWSNWMNQNLRNTSPVYKIMYDRVRSMMLSSMATGFDHDLPYTHATVGLEKEIAKLGNKISLVADYNLRTFGSLYTYLLPSIRNSVVNK